MTYDDLSNSGFLKAARAAEARQRRLIEAAPDLLKTLKWIADRIDRTSGSPNFNAEEHDRLRAAIAKAEGTQS